ncbi:hypothetical protein [Piscirickettsia litoralis]|uniref:Uncharacterized protein n=1 Tax=Piscirickettsia litoralis TaxID=1891921 RepID=A0ABX3A0S6_9GAMM|nr:hypothetical protein [Piscirickettsia litoralis]ODN41286.1 hypothetical protein BGC07_17120 [Piscirickettsia litoralis]
MDLNALLKKTKNKAKKAPASKRQRVNIAADDRPYDLDIEEKETKPVPVKKTVYKVDTNRTQTEAKKKKNLDSSSANKPAVIQRKKPYTNRTQKRK